MSSCGLTLATLSARLSRFLSSPTACVTYESLSGGTEQLLWMSRHKAPVLHGLCTACKPVTILYLRLHCRSRTTVITETDLALNDAPLALFIPQGYHHSARSFSDVNTDETVTSQVYETLNTKSEDKSSHLCKDKCHSLRLTCYQSSVGLTVVVFIKNAR